MASRGACTTYLQLATPACVVAWQEACREVLRGACTVYIQMACTVAGQAVRQEVLAPSTIRSQLQHALVAVQAVWQSMHTPATVGRTMKCTSNRSALPMRSGRSTATLLSKRPGLSRAGSNTSALLVAAMQMTILSCFESKPSSSVNSWFKVCSLSSLPTPLNRVSLPAAASHD